jgi:hypothetical protein
MWHHNLQILDPTIHKYHIQKENVPITFDSFLNGLRQDASFRTYYNTLLANSEFPGYFWEHPAITKEDLGKPYEFVLVKSNNIHKVTAEPNAFAQHLAFAQYVADFPNLRGDAHLISPTPEVAPQYYTHLASFVRHAPPEQQDAFWQRVGECYAKAIENGKRWLSTAGMGVYWLHVRLDTRAKYYRHREYR